MNDESSFCDVCHEYGCVCADEDDYADACYELGRDLTRSEFIKWQRDNAAPEVQEPVMDEEWRREIAMEAGMLGGCNAYNEVMGY
jgi:hypothetical protein